MAYLLILPAKNDKNPKSGQVLDLSPGLLITVKPALQLIYMNSVVQAGTSRNSAVATGNPQSLALGLIAGEGKLPVILLGQLKKRVTG